MTNGILMRPPLSSARMLCRVFPPLFFFFPPSSLWCVFVPTIGSSWNLLFLCDWTSLPRTPRPFAPNNAAFHLDQRSDWLRFRLLRDLTSPACLIGYKHTGPPKKRDNWSDLKCCRDSVEAWFFFIFCDFYAKKTANTKTFGLCFSEQKLTFPWPVWLTWLWIANLHPTWPILYLEGLWGQRWKRFWWDLLMRLDEWI